MFCFCGLVRLFCTLAFVRRFLTIQLKYIGFAKVNKVCILNFVIANSTLVKQFRRIMTPYPALQLRVMEFYFVCRVVPLVVMLIPPPFCLFSAASRLRSLYALPARKQFVFSIRLFNWQYQYKRLSNAAFEMDSPPQYAYTCTCVFDVLSLIAQSIQNARLLSLFNLHVVSLPAFMRALYVDLFYCKLQLLHCIAQCGLGLNFTLIRCEQSNRHCLHCRRSRNLFYDTIADCSDAQLKLIRSHNTIQLCSF